MENASSGVSFSFATPRIPSVPKSLRLIWIERLSLGGLIVRRLLGDADSGRADHPVTHSVSGFQLADHCVFFVLFARLGGKSLMEFWIERQADRGDSRDVVALENLPELAVDCLKALDDRFGRRPGFQGGKGPLKVVHNG